MDIHLDDNFWSSYFHAVFLKDIEWMRRSVFDHILPSYPDPSFEGEQAYNAALVLGEYYGDNDNGCDCETQAMNVGIDTYQGYTRMRQTALNVSTVMLWHLLEQQFMYFYTREVLSTCEERKVMTDNKYRNDLYKFEEFVKRLIISGYSIKELPSWPKVDELRLVANAVKHGPGRSLDEMYKIRPDLLILPGLTANHFVDNEQCPWITKPAAGEDIYVSDADLTDYFDAAIGIWNEFSQMISAS